MVKKNGDKLGARTTRLIEAYEHYFYYMNTYAFLKAKPIQLLFHNILIAKSSTVFHKNQFTPDIVE